MLRGDDVDLGRLPVQTCWPGDAGPFITLPAVITRDPRTGQRNVGMYRMQVLGPRSTAMHWQIHKDGRADYLFTEGRMEVAVALGLDPISAYSASAPLPKHIDEFMMAGFLRGEPLDLVKGVTVDLDVPGERRDRARGLHRQGRARPTKGRSATTPGYYTPAEQFPVFNVTAITMRRDAIYPSIVVGKPPQEDAWLGKATERIFLPAVKMTVPEIVDYDLPVAGAFHNLCIVSIKKAFPGHARKVMHAIWGLGMLSLTKGIVVVDEHVDVHDYAQVMFYVGANVDPERDVVITEGPLDHLDHAPTLQFIGGKIGIDATAKGPLEGTREWPPEIEMSDEVRELVDRRWAEYGSIGDGSRGAGRRNQSEFAPPVTTLTSLLLRPLESRLSPCSRTEDHPHVPGPSLWPVGFAVGVVVLMVGLIISWWIAGARRARRARLRVPLGARPDGGHGARARPRCRAGDRSRRRRPRRAGRAAMAPRPSEERYPRSKFLELSTLGLGGVIGGIVTAPALGFMIAPAFLKQGYEGSRPRAAHRLPRGQVRRSRPTWPTRSRARSRGARRTSVTTGSVERPAELHDHLEPLRASRLPGAAERPARRVARRSRSAT